MHLAVTLRNSYALSTHFRYGNTVLSLTGLTANTIYELTLFSVAWEAGSRVIPLTASDFDSTFKFNQDQYGNNNGIKIVGVYRSDANGSFRVGMIGNFHIYAFANCRYTGTLYPATNVMQPWGPESMAQLVTDFRLASGLYAESLTNRSPAYVWGQGVMLGALVQAAKVNSSYRSQAETLANLIQTNYWCTSGGKSGYNAGAGGCGDRYTDDNAWIALALLELYDVTGNTTYRTRAANAVAFCMLHENASGGIRWHETSTCGAAVCSTAPTCLANLILYQKTGTTSYRTNGLRLYNWLRSSGVQDASGLYHQGLNCDGTVNYGYRGYQTAVPLQAALRLYQITGTASYLTEAQRLAAAMQSAHVDMSNGILNEYGYWGGHDMTNAYVELKAVDKNIRWANMPVAYLVYLHDRCKISGRYPDAWNNTGGSSASLLANAAAARAYWKQQAGQ
jgi:hypothetical protein